MIGLSITGIDNALKNAVHILRETEKAQWNGIRATALDVQRFAIDSINTQSPGKRGALRNKSEGFYHIISKPGDPPNTDKGGLVRSIKVKYFREFQEAYVFSSVDYGAYLEINLNRPWLEPALKEKGPKLLDNIAKRMKRIKKLK